LQHTGTLNKKRARHVDPTWIEIDCQPFLVETWNRYLSASSKKDPFKNNHSSMRTSSHFISSRNWTAAPHRDLSAHFGYKIATTNLSAAAESKRSKQPTVAD
jgi:hypothetical protein